MQNIHSHHQHHTLMIGPLDTICVPVWTQLYDLMYLWQIQIALFSYFLKLKSDLTLLLPFTLKGNRWWVARTFDSGPIQQELHWSSCKLHSLIMSLMCNKFTRIQFLSLMLFHGYVSHIIMRLLSLRAWVASFLKPAAC